MLHKQSSLKRLTSCGIEIAAFENDKRSLPYPLSRKAAAGWAVIGKDGGLSRMDGFDFDADVIGKLTEIRRGAMN